MPKARHIVIAAVALLAGPVLLPGSAHAAGLVVHSPVTPSDRAVTVCASADPTGPLPVAANVTLLMTGVEEYEAWIDLTERFTYVGPMVNTYPGLNQSGLGVSSATTTSSTPAGTCQTMNLFGADSYVSVTFTATYAGFDGAGSVATCTGSAVRTGSLLGWRVTNPCEGQVFSG